MERQPHLVKWDTVIKDKSSGGLGLRSMRQLNTTFLMKLGWRLNSEPIALWARILKEKYCRGRDMNSLADRRISCSNAWRGILETRDLLNQGLGIAIGDGQQTEFWNKKWLDGKILAQQAAQPISEEHQLKRVSDYWQPGMGWDWTQLSAALPTEIIKRIASFELVEDEVGDKLIWLGNSAGKFDIKSAINLLHPLNSSNNGEWK